jgi:AraC-like DNA-binding protein
LPVALFNLDKLDESSYLIYKPFGMLIGLYIYVLGYLYLLKYSKSVETYTGRISKFKFPHPDLMEKKDQIIKALKEGKLYQDPTLTVAKMAEYLGWPINSLSSVINETFDTNFNDLINQYRVQAFKEKALHPDSHKYSILGLGQEVGFQSKASFYRAFKKETGMIPTDFLKSQP